MPEEQVTRIMPSSLDAEKAVIGSMIMDPQVTIDIATQIVTSEDFYH
jgi:replicative DNA helicase